VAPHAHRVAAEPELGDHADVLAHEAAAFAESIPHTPINALTPPKPEKWRDQNPDGIRRILPLVAETERRLGY
jgi:hypothetical protein